LMAWMPDSAMSKLMLASFSMGVD